LLGIRSASYRKELFIGIVSFFVAVDLKQAHGRDSDKTADHETNDEWDHSVQLLPLEHHCFPYFCTKNKEIVVLREQSRTGRIERPVQLCFSVVL